MKQETRLAALLALAMAVQAPAVLAQQSGQRPPSGQQPQQPTRPFRPLFGGSDADQNSHQALNLTFSALGGYDGNAYAEGGIGLPDPNAQVGGTYTNLQATLDYVKRGRRVSFNASGGSSYRHYTGLSGLNGATPWVNAGLSGALSRRTGFSLGAGASYSPYFSFGLFPGLTASETPGQAVANTTDRGLFVQPVYAYTVSANIYRQLSQRSTLSGSYALRYTDFHDQQRSLKDQTVGVGFTRSQGRAWGFHAGYAYHQGDYGYFLPVGVPFKTHDLDVGVDYEHALDRARRTTFSFRTGSTLVVTPLDNYYRVLGSAYLNRAIGRSWNLRADYRRGVQFVAGFARPFFADTVSVSTGGFIGSRLELRGAGGYSTGDLGVGGPSQNFNTYTANVGVRLALVRSLALNADYTYYHYLFNQDTLLPPGVATGLDRNGIRAGVTIWLPLLR